MQVLLGSNFSPVKASYKIKRKKLASDIENLPKVEKPPVSLQDQNAISLNTKRSPLQSIDGKLSSTLLCYDYLKYYNEPILQILLFIFHLINTLRNR